jgi:hypothetical protein
METPTKRAPRRTADVRVDATQCPGWVSGTARQAAPGERVYTHEGAGVVLRVLGRTGRSGRLLEITMDDGRKPPFYTADGNIMVKDVSNPA